MTKVINTNRKKNAPKPVDTEDNQSPKMTNNEEQFDEQLRLQHYKTDL
jgi:hypothetical protein